MKRSLNVTKQHADTKAYRKLYAYEIAKKLTPELRKIHEVDIEKFVFKAERITAAQKLLAQQPGRIVQIVSQCKADGLLD